MKYSPPKKLPDNLKHMIEVSDAAVIIGIELDGLRSRASRMGFKSQRYGNKYLYTPIQMRALKLYHEINRKPQYEILESKMNFEDI